MTSANRLYHASGTSGLRILSPQRTLSKNHYIGDYVFATDNKLMAAMYLVPNAVGIRLLGYEYEQPYLVVCSTIEAFVKLDTGGSIYTVPQDSFHDTPQQELRGTEFVSEVSVVPIAEQRYDTARQALGDRGAKIYVLSEVSFDRVMKAGTDAWEILKELAPFVG